MDKGRTSINRAENKKTNDDTLGLITATKTTQIILGSTEQQWREWIVQSTCGDHPNYCIIRINQNIKEIPWDLRRLSATQTSVKNYQLILLWKTLRSKIIIIIIIDNTIDNRMTKMRKQKWEGKQLHGRFKRPINNISHDKTWTWLRKGNFKRETESLLMVA